MEATPPSKKRNSMNVPKRPQKKSRTNEGASITRDIEAENDVDWGTYLKYVSIFPSSFLLPTYDEWKAHHLEKHETSVSQEEFSDGGRYTENDFQPSDAQKKIDQDELDEIKEIQGALWLSLFLVKSDRMKSIIYEYIQIMKRVFKKIEREMFMEPKLRETQKEIIDRYLNLLMK